MAECQPAIRLAVCRATAKRWVLLMGKSAQLSRIGCALGILLACGCASPSRRSDTLCASPGTGWQRSADAPDNDSALLDLKSGGRPIRDQLEAGVALREAWFSRGPDDLMVCRYEASEEVCPVTLVVEFRVTRGVWSAGPVLSNQCGN
jgi:hypothetical protein